MATTLYFREDPTNLGCRGESDAKLAGGATGWYFGSLLTTRGSSATARTQNTVTGPTSGIELPGTGAGDPGEYISPPLAEAVTISGTITINLWANENNMSANVAINAIIERLSSQGQVVSTIAQTARTTEVAFTGSAVNNFTVSPTSTAMLKGDRIRIRVYGDDAGTMATGFTFTFTRSGPTGAADGDSFVTFNETFSFLETDPVGTTLYPVDVASDVVIGGSVDEKVAWTSRGSNSTELVTNSRAGHAAKFQTTVSAGGNLVEWYTPKLSVFTLAGLVKANIHAYDPTAVNSLVGVELAVCDSDGANPAVWGYGTIVGTGQGELGTGESAYVIYLSGTDTAVAAQKRLRIRVYADDSVLAQSAGGTIRYGYNGAVDSSGDFWVQFAQTITEYTATQIILTHGE